MKNELKPILFNTEMVRAILNGRKTQIRRVCKGQPQDGTTSPEALGYKSPYQPGDILYVRETWAEWTGGYVYKADDSASPYPLEFVDRWRPSIHMPKEAARLFLRVTDVRAERLQSITPEDAASEGVDGCRNCLDHGGCHLPGACNYLPVSFGALWDSTIKPADCERYGWAANPWVWVICFERCEKQEDIVHTASAERRQQMATCKACNSWFGSNAPGDLCPTCERALKRLYGYAVPVIHAYWVEQDDGIVYCSNCNADHNWITYRATYCEDCGARMDGRREEEHNAPN